MKQLLSFLLCALGFVGLSAQDYSQVYLIGGAAPNGWSNDKAEAMTLVSSDEESAVFSWTGVLKASDFKFINALGTFNPSFNATTENEPVEIGKEHKIRYIQNYNNNNPDYKFVMPFSGIFKVTIDLKKLTMCVTEETGEGIPSELWATGSAIPGGTVKLSALPNQGTFFYGGELLRGDIKFSTTETPGEDTQYLIPYEEAVDITGNTQFVFTNDNSLPGWTVLVDDPTYKIHIDVFGKEVDAAIHKSQDMLYIVGGAVASGWEILNAVPFEKDPANPDLFIFDGELRIYPEHVESNLFKIVGQLDWGPYSLHPYNANEPLLESTHVREGGDDTKWMIDEDKQGRYIIKVNTFLETIEAQFVPESSKVQPTDEDKLLVLSTPDGIRVIMQDNLSALSAQLIGMDGLQVETINNAGNDFVLGNHVPKGIYLLKIDVGEKQFVQRVIIGK